MSKPQSAITHTIELGKLRTQARACVRKVIVNKSPLNISLVSGYCTLTAHSVPSGSVAQCTCAILAAAIGVGSNVANLQRDQHITQVKGKK